MQKEDRRFILLAIYIFVIVGLNELDLGIVSLLLLFPTVWLMRRAFQDTEPNR